MTGELDPLYREVAAVLRRGEVLQDGTAATFVPAADEPRNLWAPLLDWCQAHRPKGLRGLVGIAAPPGAGKSHFLAGLAATARAMRLTGFAFASMDGYHLPNAVLDTRVGIDAEGHPTPLRLLKGCPSTFDAERLLIDMQRIVGTREQVQMPGYSRILHDPVPDAVDIGPGTEWVFLEGNYLFLDDPPWRAIRELLDRRVFIDADEDLLAARLRRRHLAAGRDAGWISEHVRRTDLPNTRRILATAQWADLVLRWGADGTLRPVGRDPACNPATTSPGIDDPPRNKIQ